MQVVVNDTVHEVPFSLNDITLGRFIEYYDRYGRDLDKDLQDIVSRNYEKLLTEKNYEVTEEDISLHRQIDLDVHLDNEALAWFSFWTDCDFIEAKEHPAVQPLLTQYRVLRSLLQQSEENALLLPAEINWNGETWNIQDFKINPSSEMTFTEIITSKEVMRQTHAIGKGKWDALPYLCAVFFRKKDEQFNDELVIEGSEKLLLMQQLPMTNAIQVAFFLSICVNTWRNTLAYSNEQEQEIRSLNY